MRYLLSLLFSLFLTVVALAANVNLSWSPSTDNVGVAGYNIYRNGVKIGFSSGTSYTDATASPSTQYSYTVTAYDAAGNESGQSIAVNITTAAAQTGGGGGVFTPLHTYFISPTGNDANAGTSTAAPWATPNHPVVCGDVLLVAPGSYTNAQFGNQGQNFQQPSNCPSTSGGIDGNGGIYFATLLCAGADLMACKVSSVVGDDAIRTSHGNWAIEGFWATQRPTDSGACFSTLGTVPGVNWHHVAFINNIASTCDLAGFDTGHTGLALSGNDQTAMIGNISYNGATSLGPYKVCGSGISVIPSPSSDTSAGTHVYVAQNFLWKNMNAFDAVNQCNVSGGTHPHSDGNGIILDTWAFNLYPYQGVFANNVIWYSGSTGFQVFPQASCTGSGNLDEAKVYITNNTSWNNAQDRYQGGGSDFWLHGTCPTNGGFYNVQNNIAQSVRIYSGDDPTPVCTQIWCQVHASNLECGFGACSTTMINNGNWFWSSATPTHTGMGPYNSYQSAYPWPNTGDTFSNPGLTNPAGLPLTPPDCTGYQLVTLCMNTKYNVYNLVKPTIAPATAGYQPPGACGANALYPVWLKGVVALQASGWVNGAVITQVSGLVTKPCNL